MASKQQMTGMLGAYLAAAELTQKGLVVSITSRNARGADLLVADQAYKKDLVRAGQNKPKAGALLAAQQGLQADRFADARLPIINLRGDQRPDYYVVPSRVVAKTGATTPERSGGAIFYSFWRKDAEKYQERWSLFSSA